MSQLDEEFYASPFAPSHKSLHIKTRTTHISFLPLTRPVLVRHFFWTPLYFFFFFNEERKKLEWSAATSILRDCFGCLWFSIKWVSFSGFKFCSASFYLFICLFMYRLHSDAAARMPHIYFQNVKGLCHISMWSSANLWSQCSLAHGLCPHTGMSLHRISTLMILCVHIYMHVCCLCTYKNPHKHAQMPLSI